MAKTQSQYPTDLTEYAVLGELSATREVLTSVEFANLPLYHQVPVLASAINQLCGILMVREAERLTPKPQPIPRLQVLRYKARIVLWRMLLRLIPWRVTPKGK